MLATFITYCVVALLIVGFVKSLARAHTLGAIALTPCRRPRLLLFFSNVVCLSLQLLLPFDFAQHTLARWHFSGACGLE